MPDTVTNVIAISSGWGHGLALRRDGSVVGWGDNGSGQRGILNLTTSAVAVAAGFEFSLALNADGTVVYAGKIGYGQVGGLSNVVVLAAGNDHAVALKADGTVVSWGGDYYNQTNVPTGLSNMVAISAGYDYTLALKADGSVTSWGCLAQGGIPAGISNVVGVAAGYTYSLALVPPAEERFPQTAIQLQSGGGPGLRLDVLGYPGRRQSLQTSLNPRDSGVWTTFKRFVPVTTPSSHAWTNHLEPSRFFRAGLN